MTDRWSKRFRLASATYQRYSRFGLPLLVSGDSGLRTYKLETLYEGCFKEQASAVRGLLVLDSEVPISILDIHSLALLRVFAFELGLVPRTNARLSRCSSYPCYLSFLGTSHQVLNSRHALANSRGMMGEYLLLSSIPKSIRSCWAQNHAIRPLPISAVALRITHLAAPLIPVL